MSSNVSFPREVGLFIARLTHVIYSNFILLVMSISLMSPCSTYLIIVFLATLFTFPLQIKSQNILSVCFIIFSGAANAVHE